MGQQARIARMNAAADAEARGDPFAYALANLADLDAEYRQAHAEFQADSAAFWKRWDASMAALSKEDYHG